MTQEPQKIRRKVWLKLLAYPWALAPTTVGASALAVSWASGLSGWFAFGGGIAMLGGIGIYLTRALFGLDDATRDALGELQQEERAQQEARLDDLEARLLADRDPRTETLLRRLRELARTVEEKGLGEGINRRTRVELSMQANELFRECVKALEKSLDLWDKAQRIEDTPTRAQVYDAREKEIREVAECVKVLERLTTTAVAGSGPERGNGNLARIREELQSSLDVARRVEERMQHLEQDLPAGPESERS